MIPAPASPPATAGGAAAAAAGALGVLPLLPLARALAFKLFSPPSLAGAERLAGDVKAASYFEVVVLFSALPAAAIVFGVWLPRFLGRRGAGRLACAIPGLVFLSALPLWRAGFSAKWALFTAALLAGLACAAAVRSKLSSSAALLLVLGAGCFAYSPSDRLNLFEDGQILFGAQALARGARPYVDVEPVHGWGADGGWDAALFRVFPDPLRSFRLRRTAMTAAAAGAAFAAGVLAFGGIGWGAVSLFTTLAFCPFLSERHAFAFLALCLLIRAARAPTGGRWALAGALAAATMFSTLDFGIMLLLAGLAAPLAIARAEGEPLSVARTAVARFVAGAAAGATPFFAWLGIRGALYEFLRASLTKIPALVIATWGLPAPSLALAVRRGSAAAFFAREDPGAPTGLGILLGVLVVAAIVLVWRAAHRGFDGPDRAAVVGLLVSVLALRGVFGRADIGHRFLYGAFAGLPAAWLFYRAAAATRGRPAVLAFAAIFFVAVLRADVVFRDEIALLLTVPDRRGEETLRLPGIGTLLRDQAGELTELRSAVDEMVPAGKTFFDFGNEPALYFLLDRRAPIRYSSVPWYEGDERQQEVIAALEREKPPLAILSSGTPSDAFDSVGNRERVPLVAAYLDRHYRAIGLVGRRTLAARFDAPGPVSPAPPAPSERLRASTSSMNSRTAPRPPGRSSTTPAILRISATASEGQPENPAASSIGASGRSSPIAAVSVGDTRHRRHNAS